MDRSGLTLRFEDFVRATQMWTSEEATLENKLLLLVVPRVEQRIRILSPCGKGSRSLPSTR